MKYISSPESFDLFPNMVLMLSQSTAQYYRCVIIKFYHTTKTIFGKGQKDAGDRIYFVSDPEHVTHTLYPTVSAYFYVDGKII